MMTCCLPNERNANAYNRQFPSESYWRQMNVGVMYDKLDGKSGLRLFLSVRIEVEVTGEVTSILYPSKYTIPHNLLMEKLSLLKLLAIGARADMVGVRSDENVYYVRFAPHEFDG
jgi:hypothetical protein